VFKVRTVHVPPSLVQGRVRRLVETPDGILLVQVWSGKTWEAEPSALISPSDVRRGLDAPLRILRALGVPEADWPAAVSLVALWPVLEWGFSPMALSLVMAV